MSATSPLDPSEGILCYTDGSFSGKSKVGGWSFVAVDINRNEQTGSGWEFDTTNNRMELMAPTMALAHMADYGPCEIEIVTDSKYVADGISKWLPKWKSAGWMTSAGTPVKNQELWEALEEAVDFHTYVGWRHVKGHNGHIFNEKVDKLAVEVRMQGEIERVTNENVP